MSVAKPILNLYNGREGEPGEIMTLDELCVYLKVKKSWVYQNIRDIPHYKMCGHLRFKRVKIDAWFESQEVKDASSKKAKQKRSRLVSRR